MFLRPHSHCFSICGVFLKIAIHFTAFSLVGGKKKTIEKNHEYIQQWLCIKETASQVFSKTLYFWNIWLNRPFIFFKWDNRKWDKPLIIVDNNTLVWYDLCLWYWYECLWMWLLNSFYMSIFPSKPLQFFFFFDNVPHLVTMKSNKLHFSRSYSHHIKWHGQL